MQARGSAPSPCTTPWAHGASGRASTLVLLASHHPGAASSCFGVQVEKVWLRSESVLASRKEFPVVGSTLICRKVRRQEACRLLVFTKRRKRTGLGTF